METNGILIGHDRNYAEELSKHPFVNVRVSLKGYNEEKFAKLTGAKPEGFRLQLKALENLSENGVDCHPAVMVSFSSKRSLRNLIRRIAEIDLKLAEQIEKEELILYPKVKENIRKYGLRYLRTVVSRFGMPSLGLSSGLIIPAMVRLR